MDNAIEFRLPNDIQKGVQFREEQFWISRCGEAYGAHPTEVLGYYNRDRSFYGMFLKANARAETIQEWMDEWVFGCADREAYLDHYTQKFGMGMLDRFRAKAFYSAPASYGAAFNSAWDNDGRERTMGVTLNELETIMRERGLLYE